MSNLAASVRARLLSIAKAEGSDFNQVLVRFALERLLYRLTRSPYADRFVLKGALLFTLWYDMPHRATRDVDLLGFGASDLASITQVFVIQVCADQCRRARGSEAQARILVMRCMEAGRNDHCFDHERLFG